MQYPIIAREGYPIIYTVCAIVLACLVATLITSGGPAVFFSVLTAAALLFLLFCLYFFRDPERLPVSDVRALISPADGTVIDVKNITETEYLQGPAQRISIFMSVFNVHVNRTPISGTIDYIQYNPGKFINAFKEKASEDNENLLVGIRSQNNGPQIAVRFIAGLIARRIVFYKQKDDRVAQGERINIIRFGSRVDLFCPPDSTILVHSGQKVTAGVSVLARLTQT